MTSKEETLVSLDQSIAELKKSINTVADPAIKKNLEKTLNNLVKARAKMSPCKSFTSIYYLIIPFIMIFVLAGGYYFARTEKMKGNN